MNLTPEAVDAYKEILSDPPKYGFDFKPFAEWFEKSDKVTANHLLFKEVTAAFNIPQLPKVIFYIIMNDTYGPCDGKDEAGLLGYSLKMST